MNMRDPVANTVPRNKMVNLPYRLKTSEFGIRLGNKLGTHLSAELIDQYMPPVNTSGSNVNTRLGSMLFLN